MDFQIDSNIKFVFISTVTFKCYSSFRFLDSYLKNITGSIFEVFFLIEFVVKFVVLLQPH